MKKILLSFMLILFVSCNSTTISEDTMMLQKKFPNSVVYKLSNNESRYIIADSIVRDVRVERDGRIHSIVTIKK